MHFLECVIRILGFLASAIIPSVFEGEWENKRSMKRPLFILVPSIMVLAFPLFHWAWLVKQCAWCYNIVTNVWIVLEFLYKLHIMYSDLKILEYFRCTIRSMKRQKTRNKLLYQLQPEAKKYLCTVWSFEGRHLSTKITKMRSLTSFQPRWISSWNWRDA